MQEMMGATTVKIERNYPDDWDDWDDDKTVNIGGKEVTLVHYDNSSGELRPTGRAAAIAPEKDDLDEEFMALLGVSVEELRNTS